MTSNSQILGIILIVTVLAGSIGFFASYSIFTPQITKLQDAMITSQRNFQNLQGNFTKLSNEHQNTLSQYQTLSNQYNQALSQKSAIEAQVNQLNGYLAQKNSQIQELQSKNDALNQKIIMDKSLKIYSNLTSFYDYVRDTYGLAGDKMGYSTGSHIKMASQLAYHDLGNNVWPTQEAQYYKDVGSYSYSSASRIIDIAISYCGISNDDDSTAKIKKILDFINTRISYSYEVDNVYRAPVETMSFGSGDCDDLSILASALFTKVGIDSAYSFYKNSKDEYHSMVLVHVDKLGPYGFYSYSNLTGLGLKSGTWIIIEPQSTIGQQGDKVWMTQWQIQYASEIG